MPRKNLHMLSGWDTLVQYQWGSHTAADYFCATCGILPFRRPRDPTPAERREGIAPFDGWAVNFRCLEDVAIDTQPVVHVRGSRIRHGDG